MVQRSLLGPIGLFIKFSTLQEYGVEKLFVVENKNVETNQKNIVFLARGEKPKDVQAVAGKSYLFYSRSLHRLHLWDLKVECADTFHSAYSVLIPT